MGTGWGRVFLRVDTGLQEVGGGEIWVTVNY